MQYYHHQTVVFKCKLEHKSTTNVAAQNASLHIEASNTNPVQLVIVKGSKGSKLHFMDIC